MKLNASRAITLSKKVQFDDMNESNDLFWSLVKYVENVQDCTLQLDNMKRSILEALDEIPIRSEQGEDLTWKNMINMRVILAHKSWDIDNDILWGTVVSDFPVLNRLLSRLVFDESAENPNSPTFSFLVKRFLDLPLSQPGDESLLGNYLVLVSFNSKGKARCLRIAKRSNSQLAVFPPSDLVGYNMSVTLSGDEQNKAEFLGKYLL